VANKLRDLTIAADDDRGESQAMAVSHGVQDFHARLDELNAIHEAGHAVVALLLGTTLCYVQLNHPSQDGGNGFGRCARLAARDCESEVLIKFAGVGAELIHRKMRGAWSLLFSGSGKGDWREARLQLNSMCGNRKALVKAAKSRVTNILEDNWGWVIATSQQLREKRCLTGVEVAACCKQTTM
jgi:hypothetical protein